MHYQNDTFLFLLQEVSLKYHKSNMKYHKSSMKYHKSSQSIIKAAYSHDIAQKPFQTLGTQCPHYGQQMPNTWAIDAHHVGSECPPNGHRQTN